MTKNEKGFTAVEAVIIVVVVALLAAVGWYVYRMNNKDDKKTTTTSQNASSDKKEETKTETKPTEETKTDTKTYVTIKEWNVRAEYSGEQKLVYMIYDGKDARFSSDQLEKYGSGCMADDSPVGIIERLKPTESIGDSDGTTAQEAAKTNSAFVKVGDYYYHYAHPHGVCGNPNAPEALQEAAIKAVTDLVPKLTAVQ